jgi:hypothetical protein
MMVVQPTTIVLFQQAVVALEHLVTALAALLLDRVVQDLLVV